LDSQDFLLRLINNLQNYSKALIEYGSKYCEIVFRNKISVSTVGDLIGL